MLCYDQASLYDGASKLESSDHLVSARILKRLLDNCISSELDQHDVRT